MKSFTTIQIQTAMTDMQWQSLSQVGWLALTADAEGLNLQVLAQSPSSGELLTALASRWSPVDLQALLAQLDSSELRGLRFMSDDGQIRAVQLAVNDASAEIRHQLAAWATARQVDLVWQPFAAPWGDCRLLVMDMDSTLIQIEVIDELAKRAGVGEQVIAITEAAMRGELDFSQSLRARVKLLQGMNAAVIDQVADALPLMDGAERLLTELKRRGCKTAILSGGFTYFAERLQQRLGIDYVFSNRLAIQDGYLTGEVDGEIVDAQRKQDLLLQLTQQLGLDLSQTMAVGDGANDLLMLAKAGLGVAFRAKPKVRAQARASIEFCGLDALLYLMGHGA